LCNGSFFLISVDRGTHQCALETRLSQLVVPLVEVLLRKNLLRALLGSLGAGLIDLLGPLPCGGNQTHFAIQHAQQPAHAGGAAALVEVLAGRIPFMIDVSSNVLPHIRKGALKALAVTTPERLTAAPEVPTMKEAGVDGYELYAWDGFVLPKGTPAPVVEKFSNAIKALKNSEDAKQKILKLGAEPVFSGADEFAAFIAAEKPKWNSLVSEIKADSH
jgi:tripartite-type tricarboxylate transporter receptor subunit TctC